MRTGRIGVFTTVSNTILYRKLRALNIIPESSSRSCRFDAEPEFSNANKPVFESFIRRFSLSLNPAAETAAEDDSLPNTPPTSSSSLSNASPKFRFLGGGGGPEKWRRPGPIVTAPPERNQGVDPRPEFRPPEFICPALLLPLPLPPPPPSLKEATKSLYTAAVSASSRFRFSSASKRAFSNADFFDGALSLFLTFGNWFGADISLPLLLLLGFLL
jgi:hypothetical protein